MLWLDNQDATSQNEMENITNFDDSSMELALKLTNFMKIQILGVLSVGGGGIWI